MRHLRKALFAITLWVCFAFGCLIAPLVAILLVIPAVWKIEYIRNFVKSADRTCADWLTVSNVFESIMICFLIVRPLLLSPFHSPI